MEKLWVIVWMVWWADDESFQFAKNVGTEEQCRAEERRLLAGWKPPMQILIQCRNDVEEVALVQTIWGSSADPHNPR